MSATYAENMRRAWEMGVRAGVATAAGYAPPAWPTFFLVGDDQAPPPDAEWLRVEIALLWARYSQGTGLALVDAMLNRTEVLADLRSLLVADRKRQGVEG